MGREEEGGRRSEVEQEEVIRLVEFTSKINFLLR